MTTVPLSKTKIETKLAIIREALAELQKLAQTPKKDFIANKQSFALTEHYLRRALEATFDIANHIISRFPYSPGKRPNTLKDIAKALGEKGIVDQQFANDTLAKMAGYRNRLVHFYAELSNEELYNLINEKLPDIETFAQAIVTLMANPQKIGLEIGQ